MMNHNYTLKVLLKENCPTSISSGRMQKSEQQKIARQLIFPGVRCLVFPGLLTSCCFLFFFPPPQAAVLFFSFSLFLEVLKGPMQFYYDSVASGIFAVVYVAL